MWQAASDSADIARTMPGEFFVEDKSTDPRTGSTLQGERVRPILLQDLDEFST